MSASEHLGPQFTTRYAGIQEPEELGGRPVHAVVAAVGDEHVGHLWWDARSQRVHSVEVERAQRRQGIATTMWATANQAGVPRPRHSAERTDAGNAWVQSLR